MISIIIPVFNVEKYLKQCLDSVCNQNYKDLEIICVNDGSTDGSLEILEKYANNDSRIKIINQENKGPGAARNTGLNFVNGEYVLFVDSDDFLSENSLEEVYSNAISNDSDLVIFNFNIFNEFNNSYNPTGFLLENLFGDVVWNDFTFDYRDIKHLVMYDFFAAWFKLYKKEFLDKHGLLLPEGIVYEDVLFQIKSFIYANKISFLPKYVYNYRSSNSNSITSDNSRIWDILPVVDSVKVFLKDVGLYDYFEFEYLMFKIIHLTYKIDISEGDDYFEYVKKEFIILNDNPNFKSEDLTQKAKTMFYNVLNSNNLEEYLNCL